MTPRVEAPVSSAGEKLRGPASYFPSIEKKYGQPIQVWLDFAVARLDTGEKHMQVVEALKSMHDMGHGHANAVVGYVRSQLDAGAD